MKSKASNLFILFQGIFTQGQNPGDSHTSNDAESRIMTMVTLMNGQLAKIGSISSEIVGIKWETGPVIN